MEHALWDIAGKAAGLPAWALLGRRVRDMVRLYQSIGRASLHQEADNAVELPERFGYNACKRFPQGPGDNQMPYDGVTGADGERVRAVREAVGPDHDIAVDIHARHCKVQRAELSARGVRRRGCRAGGVHPGDRRVRGRRRCHRGPRSLRPALHQRRERSRGRAAVQQRLPPWQGPAVRGLGTGVGFAGEDPKLRDVRYFANPDPRPKASSPALKKEPPQEAGGGGRSIGANL